MHYSGLPDYSLEEGLIASISIEGIAFVRFSGGRLTGERRHTTRLSFFTSSSYFIVLYFALSFWRIF